MKFSNFTSEKNPCLLHGQVFVMHGYCALGLAAVKSLLASSRQIRARSPLHKRYEKFGDFTSAIRDFYSLSPKDVMEFKRGERVRDEPRH